MQYKPLIRLVWLGALLMAFGGLIAMSDRRYRVREQAEDMVQTGAEATT
jgi:cytochrome c-type biogenesis protein CcmF